MPPDSRAKETGPVSVRIRMYEAGHGDCFLLRFRYPAHRDRHVLIDCGTIAATWQEQHSRLKRMAKDIALECGGKLDAVVATHRHRDHIGGFARSASSQCPGNIFHSLRPDLVLQPNSEHPRRRQWLFQAKLTSQLKKALLAANVRVDTAFPNQRAVEGLRRLGKRRLYLKAGDDSKLESVLPGVRVHVLGPRAGSETLKNFHRAVPRFTKSPKHPAFPDAAQWHPCLAPPQTRWFVDRLQDLQSEQLIALAQTLNEAVNNTSLILLFQFGRQSLLFPGDTELEGWTAALRTPFAKKLIARATVYKAAHHGKSNGTPPQLTQLLVKPLVLVSARQLEPGMECYANLVDTPTARTEGAFYRDIEVPSEGLCSMKKAA